MDIAFVVWSEPCLILTRQSAAGVTLGTLVRQAGLPILAMKQGELLSTDIGSVSSVLLLPKEYTCSALQ